MAYILYSFHMGSQHLVISYCLKASIPTWGKEQPLSYSVLAVYFWIGIAMCTERGEIAQARGGIRPVTSFSPSLLIVTDLQSGSDFSV